MIVWLCLLLPIATDAADRTTASETRPADAVPVSSEETPSTGVKYHLRYQFHPNEKLRYQLDQQMIQKATADFGEKKDRSVIQQRRVYSISDVTDDGTATASMQFESVRMELQTDDQDPEIFHSGMKAEDVPKRFYHTARSLKSEAPTYTLPPSGIPVDSEGFLQASESNQAGFMFPLPVDDVGIGESWTARMNVRVRIAEGTFRQVVLLRSHRLVKVENDVATISFSTSIVSSVKTPAERVQLLQATPQGEITFDISRGRLLSKEFRYDSTVPGAFGSNTMLTVVGKSIEKLIEADTAPAGGSTTTAAAE
ncbi:MAG: hypothetical protein R3C49_26005 [Planctomycetaceae bacterium]